MAQYGPVLLAISPANWPILPQKGPKRPYFGQFLKKNPIFWPKIAHFHRILVDF